MKTELGNNSELTRQCKTLYSALVKAHCWMQGFTEPLNEHQKRTWDRDLEEVNKAIQGYKHPIQG